MPTSRPQPVMPGPRRECALDAHVDGRDAQNGEGVEGIHHITRRQPALLAGRHRLHLRSIGEPHIPVDLRLGRAGRGLRSGLCAGLCRHVSGCRGRGFGDVPSRTGRCCRRGGGGGVLRLRSIRQRQIRCSPAERPTPESRAALRPQPTARECNAASAHCRIAIGQAQ